MSSERSNDNPVSEVSGLRLLSERLPTLLLRTTQRGE